MTANEIQLQLVGVSGRDGYVCEPPEAGRHAINWFALREFFFDQASGVSDAFACAGLYANLRTPLGNGANIFQAQPPAVDFNAGGASSYRDPQFGLDAVAKGGPAAITIASWLRSGMSFGSRVQARPFTVKRRVPPRGALKVPACVRLNGTAQISKNCPNVKS